MRNKRMPAPPESEPECLPRVKRRALPRKPTHPNVLRERLYEHLRRVEERLFQQLDSPEEAPNATLARELRQYIHDVLDSLDRQESEGSEAEGLDLTLERLV